MRWYVAFVLFFLCSVVARGQDKVYLNHILPINTTEHFENIRVIESNELMLLNAQTLKDVLQYELLFDLNYRVTEGFNVYNQGLQRRYIKVLRNGVAVYPELFNEVQPEQISVIGIDRIEVLLSPGGIYNGSGSVGCVINLITSEFVNDTTYTEVQASLSDRLSLQNHIQSRFSRSRHALNITLNRNFDSGYQGKDSGRVMQFAPFEQLSYHIDYRYKLKPSLNIQFSRNQIQHFSVFKSYPLEYSTRAYDIEQEHNSVQNMLKLYGMASKVHQFELGSSYSRLKEEQLTYRRELSSLDRFYQTVESPFDSMNLGEGHFWGKIARENPSFKLNYDAGVGMRLTRDLNRLFINGIRTSTTQYYSYLRAFYKPSPELVLAGGLKWLTSNHFSSMYLPELKLKYQVSPDFNLSIGYYSSYRAPDFGELHYLQRIQEGEHRGIVVGNLNLVAERSSAFFTGFKYRKNGWLAMSSFQANTISRVIQPDIQLIDSSWLWGNPGQIRSISNTLLVQYRSERISVKSGLAIIGTNAIAHRINQFRFYPQVTQQFMLDLNAMQLGLFGKYTGTIASYTTLKSGEIAASDIEPSLILDLSANAPIKQWYVQFGIHNLLNVFELNHVLDRIQTRPIIDKQINQSVYYTPGRRVYLTLKYTW